MNPMMKSTLFITTSSNKSLRFLHFHQSRLMRTNPSSSTTLMASSSTSLSLAEENEEEGDDEEWTTAMLIFPSFCFGGSNLRVENGEINPVSRERLREM